MPIAKADTIVLMRSEFGSRLYIARKYAKLTQSELAKRVGMSQPNLAELESKGQASGLTPAIAIVCGVSVQWLAYGIGGMTDTVPQGAPTVEITQPSKANAGAVDASREFYMNDIGDMLRQFNNPAELRTIYARILGCIDQYSAELLSKRLQPDHASDPAAGPAPTGGKKPKGGQSPADGAEPKPKPGRDR